MTDSPMHKLINRLFTEAQIPEGNPLIQTVRAGIPGRGDLPQPPALECQLVLKGGYTTSGVLTTTPEGTMRMVSLAQKQDKSMIMADHFFDISDVQTIIIGREMPKSLIQPVSNGNAKSPIIIGH